MRIWTIAALTLLAAAGAGTAWYVMDAKTRQAEIALKRRQAELRTAEMKRKTAEAEKTAQTRKAEAAKADAEAKAEASRKAVEDAKTEMARRAGDEARRKTAEAEAETARAAARKAEAERAAAEEKRKEAQAIAEAAAITNEIRQAELRTAESKAAAASAERKAKEADLKAQELKKNEYESLIAEVKALQEELRRREEDTRPDRTLRQLLDKNEAARAAEKAEDAAKAGAETPVEDGTEEAAPQEDEPAAATRKQPAFSPPEKPPTAGDLSIRKAAEKREFILDEGRAAVRRSIVGRLEEIIRKAAEEGRREDAQAYLDALLSLYPDYTPGGGDETAR